MFKLVYCLRRKPNLTVHPNRTTASPRSGSSRSMRSAARTRPCSRRPPTCWPTRATSSTWRSRPSGSHRRTSSSPEAGRVACHRGRVRSYWSWVVRRGRGGALTVRRRRMSSQRSRLPAVLAGVASLLLIAVSLCCHTRHGVGGGQRVARRSRRLAVADRRNRRRESSNHRRRCPDGGEQQFGKLQDR